MTDLGFGKHQRLLTAKEFQRVFDHHSLKASSKYFLLLAAQNSLSHSRIGFIIAKKNIKTAVHRNRVKRLSREYFRTSGKALSGYDIILLAKRGLDEMNNQDIFATLEQQWQRLIRQDSKNSASD